MIVIRAIWSSSRRTAGPAGSITVSSVISGVLRTVSLLGRILAVILILHGDVPTALILIRGPGLACPASLSLTSLVITAGPAPLITIVGLASLIVAASPAAPVIIISVHRMVSRVLHIL